MTVFSDLLEKIYKEESKLTETQRGKYIRALVSKTDNVWDLIHKDPEVVARLLIEITADNDIVST
jgi:hypothetical protein